MPLKTKMHSRDSFLSRLCSLSKNLFFDRLTEVKGGFKTSKPHLSAYMDTVGGGLRSKSKRLAQQALFPLRMDTIACFDTIVTIESLKTVKLAF